MLAYILAEVGEGLRGQYEAETEEKRQRSIRSTEEVVRREETEKREKALQEAKEQWDKERQQLFVEAHQNQLRTIAKHAATLEEKLKTGFEAKMKEVTQQHKHELEYKIEKTWIEAEVVQKKMIQEARLEERAHAEQEAERVMMAVAAEKAAERRQAILEKEREMKIQQDTLGIEKEDALVKQKQDLEIEFQKQFISLREECNQRYEELKKEYETQVAKTGEVQEELVKMAELKTEWEEKYARLRMEFADFIDKVPGFKADYILN